MPPQTNALFAILSTTFSREDTGRVTPHILGAIFDVDANGVATDATAVDFDGKTLRRWPRNNFGTGKHLTDHVIPAERAIIFPITQQSADDIKAAINEVSRRLRRVEDGVKRDVKGVTAHDSDPFFYDTCDRNGFYFELYPKHNKNEKLERHGRDPLDFSGTTTPVSYAERESYRRAAHACPKAAINCVTFLQEVLEKIGGVPLEDFVARDGMRMPRDGDPFLMEKFMMKFADNQGKPYNKRVEGRMIDLGEGRKAYALDRPTGFITAALNSIPKQHTADGRSISLPQYLLEESAPFHDASLTASMPLPKAPAASYAR